LEENDCGIIEVLHRHFPGGTEENHEIPLSGWSVPLARFEQKYESNLNGRDNMGDLGTDRMIMTGNLTDKWWEVVEWIHRGQNRKQTLVNTVMNLRFPQKWESFTAS
jgi:hypothetical protein